MHLCSTLLVALALTSGVLAANEPQFHTLPIEGLSRIISLGQYDKNVKAVSIPPPLPALKAVSRAVRDKVILHAGYQAHSYCPRRKDPKRLAKMPYPHYDRILHVETAQNLCGYIIALDIKRKRIIVSFRGAMNNVQKLHVGDVTPVPYSYLFPVRAGKTPHVHFGFFWGYMTIRRALMDKMAEYVYRLPGWVVSVTGYSYGAPIAVYAALEIVANKKQVPDAQGIRTKVELVTFGSPRPGDAEFARLVDYWLPGYIRVTHTNDIYPHFPPPAWLGYMHPGTEVHYTRPVRQNLVQCAHNKFGEDPRCSMSQGKHASEIPHHQYWTYPDCAKGEEWGDPIVIKDDVKKKLKADANALSAKIKEYLRSEVIEEWLYKVGGHVRVQ